MGLSKCILAVMSGILHILTCWSSASATNQEEICVQAGSDVLLKCQVPRNSSILAVEWQRLDIEMDDFVLFCRERRPYENYQNPSYRGRVRMAEPSMTGGNVSIILSNTTVNDSGTYQCKVPVTGPARQRKAASATISIIKLNVTLPGENEDGGPGLMSIVVIVVVVLVAAGIVAGGVWIYRKRHQNDEYGLRPREDSTNPATPCTYMTRRHSSSSQ